MFYLRQKEVCNGRRLHTNLFVIFAHSATYSSRFTRGIALLNNPETELSLLLLLLLLALAAVMSLQIPCWAKRSSPFDNYRLSTTHTRELGPRTTPWRQVQQTVHCVQPLSPGRYHRTVCRSNWSLFYCRVTALSTCQVKGYNPSCAIAMLSPMYLLHDKGTQHSTVLRRKIIDGIRLLAQRQSAVWRQFSRLKGGLCIILTSEPQ